jgi:hypothetical protein
MWLRGELHAAGGMRFEFREGFVDYRRHGMAVLGNARATGLNPAL